MRFLLNEHADITAALRALGIDPATVLFVKRRGRLHVEVPGRPDAFAFFRKSGTRLDEQGRWQERVDYFIGTNKADARHWTEVLSVFDSWLKGG